MHSTTSPLQGTDYITHLTPIKATAYEHMTISPMAKQHTRLYMTVNTVRQHWGGGILSFNNVLFAHSDCLWALSAEEEMFFIIIYVGLPPVKKLRERTFHIPHLTMGMMLSVDFPSETKDCLSLKSKEKSCSHFHWGKKDECTAVNPSR